MKGVSQCWGLEELIVHWDGRTNELRVEERAKVKLAAAEFKEEVEAIRDRSGDSGDHSQWITGHGRLEGRRGKLRTVMLKEIRR